MAKILIVEDAADISRMLAETLEREGHVAEAAYTGLEGMEQIRRARYDLILLDLMLPYKSGDELLRWLRQSSDMPVIVLSAKSGTQGKIELLKLGADDYITKPFDLDEVAARVEAALRRAPKAAAQRVYRYKDLALNVEEKRLTAGGQELELTAKEFKIMELLLQSPSRVYTKSNLYEAVWQEEYLGDENVVKTHISNLRGKLRRSGGEEPYIETVWGLGYRLYKIGEAF